MAAETERVTLRLPVSVLQDLDAFIQTGEYTTRSEAIRAAIKHFVRAKASEVKETTEARKTLLDASSQQVALQQLQEQLKQQQEMLKQLMKK